MPDYTYRALNSRGRMQRGALGADSEYELQSQLSQAGLALIEARAAKTPRVRPILQRGQLRDLGQFCRHVAQLERATVRLTDTLADVAASLPPGLLRQAVAHAIGEVENGVSLSAALAQNPKAFPAPMAALVAAGEATGRLGEMFAMLASHFDWRAGLRAKLTRTLAYPVFSLAVMLAVVAFLLGAVVPQTSAFLHDMGVTLPLHTRLLLATADAVAAWGLMAAGLIAAVIAAGMLAYRRYPPLAYWLDRQILRLPAIGSVWQRLELARLTRSLAMMVAGGIPLLPALETATAALRNRALREETEILREQLQAGVPLSRAARLSGRFPPLVQRMLAAGEAGDRLDGALANVADFYESDVQCAAEDLVTATGPVVTLLTGGLLVWLVTAIFLPLYDALPQLN